jgi:hypothetical protein
MYFPKAGETSGRKSTVCGITGILSVRQSPDGRLANYILDQSCAPLARLLRHDAFIAGAQGGAFASKQKICNSIFSRS